MKVNLPEEDNVDEQREVHRVDRSRFIKVRLKGAVAAWRNHIGSVLPGSANNHLGQSVAIEITQGSDR